MKIWVKTDCRDLDGWAGAHAVPESFVAETLETLEREKEKGPERAF